LLYLRLLLLRVNTGVIRIRYRYYYWTLGLLLLLYGCSRWTTMERTGTTIGRIGAAMEVTLYTRYLRATMEVTSSLCSSFCKG
jgi:hypothetical protein